MRNSTKVLKLDYKKQGKANRAAGKRFELKVREDLESKGWTVSKWQNNVDFNLEHFRNPKPQFKGKLVPCKAKFNPFTKSLMMNSGGFPDFIAFTKTMPHFINNKMEAVCNEFIDNGLKYIIGVESKVNGQLSAEEKAKCRWYLDNNIFSKILIAKKGEKRGEIVYTDFTTIKK